MPRHQTFKFKFTFKAKRYNVNLITKWIGTQAFLGVYLWLNEEIEYDEKVTATPNKWRNPNCRNGRTTV